MSAPPVNIRVFCEGWQDNWNRTGLKDSITITARQPKQSLFAFLGIMKIHIYANDRPT
jgi:hypothetical protein